MRHLLPSFEFSAPLSYTAQRIRTILLEQTSQKSQESQSSVASTFGLVTSVAVGAAGAIGAAGVVGVSVGLGPLLLGGGALAAYVKTRRRTVKFSERVDNFLRGKNSRLESLKAFINQELQNSNLQKELSEVDVLVLAYTRGVEQLSSSLTPPNLDPEQWLKKISTEAIEEIQQLQDYADINQ